jgi:hypothetical protein
MALTNDLYDFAMHFCTNTSTDDPYLVIILHGMEFDNMILLVL